MLDLLASNRQTTQPLTRSLQREKRVTLPGLCRYKSSRGKIADGGIKVTKGEAGVGQEFELHSSARVGGEGESMVLLNA